MRESFGCSGQWVDGTGAPVSLDQRRALSLVQQECKVSKTVGDKDIEVGCHPDR